MAYVLHDTADGRVTEPRSPVNGVSISAEDAASAVEFLGLRFAMLDMAQAISAVKRASEGAEWCYVVTPNAAHLARLRFSDSILLPLYANASFCFLDSRVISIVARLTGLHPPPVVTGADLVEQLFLHEITKSTKICLVGGDNGTAEQIRTRFGVSRLSHVNPSLGFWRDEDEVVRTVSAIVANQADYTFLAVGSPQQEILAARVATAGGARGVGICVGASIEFLTGAQKRAPPFLRRMALEWAYRLAHNPRRLGRRYMIESPWGVVLVVREAIRQHIIVRSS
jgi:N-acetylglucosaminyldiphosphoundecaprenol N-acetyl-beta-D-mannosaminyltransferase